MIAVACSGDLPQQVVDAFTRAGVDALGRLVED